MVKLKSGTRVWHKELGVGIVESMLSNEAVQVHFEGKDCYTICNRLTIFTKGDRVIYKFKEDKRWHKNTIDFFSPIIHNHQRNLKSKYTVGIPDVSCIYVWDVEHAKEPKQGVLFPEEKAKLTKTINATIQNHPICAEDLDRTVQRAGQLADVGVKADKVLKTELFRRMYTYEPMRYASTSKNVQEFPKDSKEYLTRRLKTLELKSKIEELNSKIKELENAGDC